MNWIDILVLVFTLLIIASAIAYLIYKIIKGRTCNCPAAKHIKKDLKKAHKEIKNKH